MKFKTLSSLLTVALAMPASVVLATPANGITQTRIPETGSTLALAGMALVGVAFAWRSRLKK